MPTSEVENKVHLVLGSGGARCISYVGALSVLAEHRISFASVSACSAGALIGALLCAGVSPKELEARILREDLSRLAGKRIYPWPFHFLGLLKKPFAIYENTGFQKLFLELLDGRDPEFKELHIPLAIACVDIKSNRILVYSKGKPVEQSDEIKVSEAIEIATAVPLVYPPYEGKSGQRVVVDAAVVTQCPVWIPAGYHDHLPIVAMTNWSSTYKTKLPKFFMNYLVDVYVAGIHSRDYYFTQQLPRVRSIDIDCGNIPFSKFNLSEKDKKFLIKAGRKRAERLLAEWGDDLWNIHQPPLESDIGATSDNRAQQRAAELITGFQRKLPRLLRDQVFMSYSHQDLDWLDRIKQHLTRFSSNRTILAMDVKLWDDGQIKQGEKWRDEIQEALASAKVAVLLVSKAFLASDFIENVELDYTLKADQSINEDLTLIWVTVGDCEWRDTPLNDYQAAYNPDKPLNSLAGNELESALDEICKKIADAFDDQKKSKSDLNLKPMN